MKDEKSQHNITFLDNKNNMKEEEDFSTLKCQATSDVSVLVEVARTQERVGVTRQCQPIRVFKSLTTIQQIV